MHVVERLARFEKCEPERRQAVYARVSTLEGPPELMDESLRLAREVVLPQGRLMEGFKGMIALARIIHERLRKLLKERAISIVPDVPRPDARGPS
jgi:hypothetical protein